MGFFDKAPSLDGAQHEDFLTLMFKYTKDADSVQDKANLMAELDKYWPGFNDAVNLPKLGINEVYIAGATGVTSVRRGQTAYAIEKTISNAVDVDKGDGTVGIPITAHGFSAGDSVTIAGVTILDYDGSYVIRSVSTDEIVITASWADITFVGDETAKSSTGMHGDAHPGGATKGYTEIATDIAIEMAIAWEETILTKRIPFVVKYKGEVVEISYIKAWDGVSDNVIILNNSDGYFGSFGSVAEGAEFVAERANFSVTLIGALLWEVTGNSLPNISLPMSTEKTKIIGTKSPAVERTSEDGKEITGTINFLAIVNDFMVSDGTDEESIINPLENVYSAIYGSNYNVALPSSDPKSGSDNSLDYISDGLAVVQIQYLGRDYDDTTNYPSRTWGKYWILRRCKITGFPAPENISGDSTAPVTFSCELLSSAEHSKTLKINT